MKIVAHSHSGYEAVDNAERSWLGDVASAALPHGRHERRA